MGGEWLPQWPQGISDFVRWRASQHLSHGTHTATHYRTGCQGRLRQRLGPEIWAIFQGTTVLRLFATPSSLDSIVASFDSRFVQRKYPFPKKKKKKKKKSFSPEKKKKKKKKKS